MAVLYYCISVLYYSIALKYYRITYCLFITLLYDSIVLQVDRASTVVKVLCCKSEGRWLDPSWCQWIFH